MNWTRQTFGQIIEKEISSSDIWCSNVMIWNTFLKTIHTWCSSEIIFVRRLNKAIH